MFKKLEKYRQLLIAVFILLVLIIAVAVIGSKQKEVEELGETEEKIEYGEDVAVENDTPGLDVSEDDGTNENGTSVPGSWENDPKDDTSNITDNDEKNSTNGGNTNIDTEDSNKKSDQNILEDDKSWGTIF